MVNNGLRGSALWFCTTLAFLSSILGLKSGGVPTKVRKKWACLQLDEVVERDKWGMTPPTINAYYTPTKNQVTH